MKNKLFLLSAFCALSAGQVFADPCTEVESALPAGSMIHCAWVGGFGSDYHDGRYIKVVENDNKGNTGIWISCSHEGVNLVTSDSFGLAAGVFNTEYFMCTDLGGKNCTSIGVDAYTVTESPSTQQYSATPKINKIAVPKSVMDAYPTCLTVDDGGNLKRR